MTKEIYENSVLDESTDNIVCTAAGIEGFCMKKFVAVRQ